MTDKDMDMLDAKLPTVGTGIVPLSAGTDGRLGRLVNRREWVTFGALILHNAHRRGRSVVEVHDAVLLMFGVDALHEILATDYDDVVRWLVEDKN